jgi:hypothetical protein
MISPTIDAPVDSDIMPASRRKTLVREKTMSSTQRPAGGMVSKVNGQFYVGGEFMPVSGLFCGKKGEERKAKWEKAAPKNAAKDLGGDKMFELSEHTGGGVCVILGYAIANDAKQAEAAFSAKTKVYSKKV